MTSDDEPATPTSTPPSRRRKSKKTKARRRRLASSSSSEEAVPRKLRKRTNSLSTKDILKLVKHVSKDSPRNSWNNNLNNVIPEFDPSNRTQTIECWLRKVNECAVIYGWDEKQIVHFSLQKLAGLAKRWFEALPTVIYTWNEWQVKLKKAFPSEENYGRLLEEMLNRTSRSDESLREYFYDKLGLLNRCEISGRKAIDCIIHGISDRSIRSGAQAQNSSEPEDLLNFLASQRPQSLLNKSYERVNQRPSSSNPDSNSNNAKVSSITCYNCRSNGHPYYKCTEPIIKCRKCNRIGHDYDDCKLESLVFSNSKSGQVENTSEKNI